MRAGPVMPCRWCGRPGCSHPALMRLYGIRSGTLPRDEKDELRERRLRDSEEMAEEELRRLEE